MNFKNKVVVITGAGSGIGEETAIQFAKLSATLSLIDKNVDNLQRVAQECEKLSNTKVLKVITDVTKDVELKQAVDNTIKNFGKIDVLVNCAGIFGDRGILDSDLLSVFDTVMNVNLRSIIALTHYAAPALIDSKGCVINIASVMSRMVSKGSLPYNLSKAAVAYFTRNVALNLAEKGVRVNSISPGPVETNILINSGMSQKESDDWWVEYAKFVPLKHNINASEIAEMTIYLASDKARSITGADILIDSGITMSGTPTNVKQ